MQKEISLLTDSIKQKEISLLKKEEELNTKQTLFDENSNTLIDCIKNLNDTENKNSKLGVQVADLRYTITGLNVDAQEKIKDFREKITSTIDEEKKNHNEQTHTLIQEHNEKIQNIGDTHKNRILELSQEKKKLSTELENNNIQIKDLTEQKNVCNNNLNSQKNQYKLLISSNHQLTKEKEHSDKKIVQLNSRLKECMANNEKVIILNKKFQQEKNRFQQEKNRFRQNIIEFKDNKEEDTKLILSLKNKNETKNVELRHIKDTIQSILNKNLKELNDDIKNSPISTLEKAEFYTKIFELTKNLNEMVKISNTPDYDIYNNNKIHITDIFNATISQIMINTKLLHSKTMLIEKTNVLNNLPKMGGSVNNYTTIVLVVVILVLLVLIYHLYCKKKKKDIYRYVISRPKLYQFSD